jgi:hypothetical protein
MTAWVASGATLARVNLPSGASLTTTRLGTIVAPLEVEVAGQGPGRDVSRVQGGVAAGGDGGVDRGDVEVNRGRGVGAAGRRDPGGAGHLIAAGFVDQGSPRVPAGCPPGGTGVSPTNLAPPGDDPVPVYQPLTSTTTWELPARL